MARVVSIRANREISANANRPIIELTKYGKLLCHERAGGRWFRSSQWNVEDALAQFQGLYENIICVSLNDLYELLGIYPTNQGSLYGWNYDIHSKQIDKDFGTRTMLFSTQMIENYENMGEPVLVLNPIIFPEKDFKEEL